MIKYTLRILILLSVGFLTSCIPDNSSEIKDFPEAEVNHDPSGAPPRGFTEDYAGHDLEVRRQYFDDYTAVFYDSIVDRSITWPFEFFSDVWEQTSNTYDKPSDRLFVVGHGNPGEGIYTTIFDGEDSESLIDFTVSEDSIGSSLDKPIGLIAGIVESSAYGVHGSPAKAQWKNKFVQIFTFDIYKKLEMEEDSIRVKEKYLKDKADFPNDDTFWFKDWFLPIYQNYNGATALSNFFQILSNNFPIDGNDYARDMDLGEMVHFFSGATGKDLEPLAEKAFDWNEEHQLELEKARAVFPDLSYPFEPTSEMVDLTEDASITVSQDNKDGKNSTEGSSKLIDGDENTKFLTDGFPMDSFWMQQSFSDPVTVDQYTLTSGNDAPGRDLKSWTLSGSNDGENFTLIDTRIDQSWNEERNKTKKFFVDNDTAYKYYRLDVQENNGASLMQVSEWRLKGLKLL